MNFTHRAALLAGILLTGCDRQTETIQPIALKGTVVSDGEFLAEPRRLLVLGDRLLVVDDLAPHVHVLDPATGRLVASGGREGGGPGEFESATDIQEHPARDGSFWIYDPELLRSTRMTLDSARATPRLLEVINFDALPPRTLYLQPVVLDDSTIVASGILPEGRLVRARRNGRPLGFIGSTPSAPAGQEVPATVLQHAWEGPVERSADGSRIALATRNGDLIEIYGVDGSLLHQVRGSSGFDPVFTARRTSAGVGMATGNDLRFGYGDLTSTDRYLFALFSGVTRGELPGEAQFGKRIHVFGWDGERVATLELPERARGISVTPDGKALFVIHREPRPAVVRYSIEEHLPRRG